MIKLADNRVFQAPQSVPTRGAHFQACYISIHNSRTRARSFRSSRGFWGSGTRQNSRKPWSEPLWPRERSKSLQDGPKSAPRAFETASRALQEASRRPQERSKSPRDGPKSAPRRVKMAPRGVRACSKPLTGPSRACSELLENLSSVIEAAEHYSRRAFGKAFEEAVGFHSTRVNKLQVNWLRA